METIMARGVGIAIILLSLITASGFIGSAIRPRFGFLAGFFLGPFGWLLAAVLRVVDVLEEIRDA